MVFLLGLEWDSLSIATKVSNSFRERKFTDRKGSPLGDSMTLGLSEDGKETGFIVEGFDNNLMFGLVVQISNQEKFINIYGGRFNKSKTMNTSYSEKFTDLGKASKYFEKALNEYDTEVKK